MKFIKLLYNIIFLIYNCFKKISGNRGKHFFLMLLFYAHITSTFLQHLYLSTSLHQENGNRKFFGVDYF